MHDQHHAEVFHMFRLGLPRFTAAEASLHLKAYWTKKGFPDRIPFTHEYEPEV
jgi:hypothetical protein